MFIYDISYRFCIVQVQTARAEAMTAIKRPTQKKEVKPSVDKKI